MENNFSFKPTTGSTGSKNERLYAEGIVPGVHQRLLNAFKLGLEGETKGELVLQKVLDYVHMTRTHALKIIKQLVKYGYIKYEAKPKQHRVYIELLKGADPNNPNNETR